MLIFLIFRAEAYTCWSARFARSCVGGVARLFKEISVFFGFWYFFSFFKYFCVILVICGFFFMKKRLFLAILLDLGIFSHSWLFIMKGRLFITKKDCFWSFHQIQVFLVICGFLSWTGGFEA